MDVLSKNQIAEVRQLKYILRGSQRCSDSKIMLRTNAATVIVSRWVNFMINSHCEETFSLIVLQCAL
jgi:hypothetical protein